MNQSLPKESSSPTLLPRVFLGLYLLHSAIVFAFLITYKVSRNPMTLLPPNKFGYAVIFATVLGMAGILLVAPDVVRYRTTRSLKLSVALNIVSVVLLFFSAESLVRVLIYTRAECIPSTWVSAKTLARRGQSLLLGSISRSRQSDPSQLFLSVRRDTWLDHRSI